MWELGERGGVQVEGRGEGVGKGWFGVFLRIELFGVDVELGMGVNVGLF